MCAGTQDKSKTYLEAFRSTSPESEIPVGTVSEPSLSFLKIAFAAKEPHSMTQAERNAEGFSFTSRGFTRTLVPNKKAG